MLRSISVTDHGLAITLHGIDAAHTLPVEFYHMADARYMLPIEMFDVLLDCTRSLQLCTMSQALKNGSSGCAIITFDDGLLSDYHVAFPRLRMKKIPATFFVNPSNLGRPGYVTSEQLCEMHAHHMEIGSHGITHRKLVTLSSREALAEIEDSKKALEDIVQSPVTSFAPVGGHYRRWMTHAARNAGYSAFASMIPGWTNLGDRTFIFRRNHVQAHHTADQIAAILRGDRKLLARNQLRYAALNVARRSLGMHNYDTVRQLLLGANNPQSQAR